MALGQPASVLEVSPPSLAGKLPQGFRVTSDFVNTTETCGSQPAGDGVGSVNIIVECKSAIGGKPAPTEISVDFGFC